MAARSTDKVTDASTKGETLTVAVTPADLANYPVQRDPTISGPSAVTDNFVSSKYPTWVFAN